MSSLNKVLIIGNLGADPEVRSMQSGGQVVNLRIATSESWRDKQSGERQEKTTWHQVVIFNEHLAKIAEEYLRKGSKVYLEGQLQTRSWEDQQGQKRYTTEIVLQKYRGELVMLDSRGQGAHNDQPNINDTGAGYGAAKDGSAPANFSNDMDDEIPPF